MSLFIDKNKRRKSPIALAAFGATLLDLVVYAVLYGLLAEPLYRAVSLGGETATTATHAVIIAVVGTAVCCLLFLLPDKRVAPYGFAGLGVVLLMFYAATAMLGAAVRGGMLQLITMYGLAPVLVGNAVAWPVFGRFKRRSAVPGRKKTIQEEIREAAAVQRAREAKKQPAPAAEPTVGQTDAAPQATADSAADAALFGPGEGTGAGQASPFRSAQDEALLFYEDEDDG